MGFKEELQVALSQLPLSLPVNVVTDEKLKVVTDKIDTSLANKANVNEMVTSVNGQAGEVILDLTGAVKSVNGHTGTVKLFTSGTSDMQSGTTELGTGEVYFMYE